MLEQFTLVWKNFEQKEGNKLLKGSSSLELRSHVKLFSEAIAKLMVVNGPLSHGQ